MLRRQNNVNKRQQSGVSVTSSKRNGGSAEHQNRNDQGNSSLVDNEASSSSIWARLLVSSSKLSGLQMSNASLRTANRPGIPVY